MSFKRTLNNTEGKKKEKEDEERIFDGIVNGSCAGLGLDSFLCFDMYFCGFDYYYDCCYNCFCLLLNEWLGLFGMDEIDRIKPILN